MHFFYSVLSSFLVIAGCFAFEFHTDFSNSRLKIPGVDTPSATYIRVDEPEYGFKQALLLKRGSIPTTFYFRFQQPVPQNEDFRLSFDLYRQDAGSSFVLTLRNYTENRDIGSIYLSPDGQIRLKGKEMRFISSPIRLTPKKRFRLTVECFRKTGILKVSAEEKEFCIEIDPAISLQSIQFTPQLPEGECSLIDNFEFNSSPSLIRAFKNVLPDCRVELFPLSNSSEARQLVDGNRRDPVILPVRTTVTFNLSERVEAIGVQIFGGNPQTVRNPSGDVSPRKYIIEGLSNGSWLELVREENAPKIKEINSLHEEDFSLRYDFNPIPLDALRIRFTDTHDTGLRFSSPETPLPIEQRQIVLREVELFSTTPVESKMTPRKQVDMEFRLPVYRNQQEAELTIQVVTENMTPPQIAGLTLYAPDGKVKLYRELILSPGKQRYPIPLASLPNGRNKAVLTFKDGEITRLLRIDRLPDAQQLLQEPMQMTGKKLFFTPDNYGLAERTCLPIRTAKVTAHRIAESCGDDFSAIGKAFYQNLAGQYVLEITDRNIRDGRESVRILTSQNITGPYKTAESPPDNKRMPFLYKRFRPSNPFIPPPPPDTRFEHYNPNEDGKLNLRNVRIFYHSVPHDYGCLKALPRTFYVGAKTAAGHWVLTSRTPLLIDKWFYAEDEFDDGWQTNDNFVGTYLSPDGKDELFFIHGQTVKRSAPYAVPYDNLQTAFRLLALYSTQDGINWRFRNYLDLPTENDSPGYQHYGGRLLEIAEGNLLLLFLSAYDAETQQIFLELHYSRDGIRFHRIDSRPLLQTNNPESWFFGHIFMRPEFLLAGDSMFGFVNYAASFPHFYPEVFSRNLSEITGKDFRNRFEKRQLAERLPWFSQIGGWEGLARHAKKGRYSVGLLEFRKDGFFAMVASTKEGHFITRNMKAAGTLSANLQVGKGGVAEFSLLSPDGKSLKQCLITQSGTSIILFDELPKGMFRISGKLRNAELYCLNFSREHD